MIRPIASLLLVAALGLVGILTGNGVRGFTASFEPARQGEATYTVDSVTVEYPLRDDVTGATDSSQAGVSFRAAWATGTYPGEVRCEVRLLDERSNTVGLDETSIDSLIPSSSMPANLPIRVQSAPTRGQITCEAGQTVSDGAGYAVSLEGPPTSGESDGASLQLLARWVDEYPGTRACTATISVKDGSTRRVAFTLEVADGTSFPLRIPQLPPTDIESVSVECGPISGPEGGA